MPTPLTHDEKCQLLSLASEAISSQIIGSPANPLEITSDKLFQKLGCFVTIKVNDKLRGCIGNLISDKPLYLLVQEMAIAAATKDPRFYPMKKKDLDDFDLEISVLSPLHKIENFEEIQVGVHGIYLEKDSHRGVLLPQVAIEYGWDRTVFLNQTCIKAGLPSDGWHEGADIYIFSAEVF